VEAHTRKEHEYVYIYIYIYTHTVGKHAHAHGTRARHGTSDEKKNDNPLLQWQSRSAIKCMLYYAMSFSDGPRRLGVMPRQVRNYSTWLASQE
jgi:hypothetical protein